MESQVLKKSQNALIIDGRYQIIAQVGRGKNSLVYKTKDLQARDAISEIVALKLLTKTSIDLGLKNERMKNESVSLLSCNHQNVVKLYDFVNTGEICYLTLEYAERGDLKHLIEGREQSVDVPSAFKLIIQLLNGLEVVHEHGIIHRDIKPENLLLTAKGVLKLADFGLARLLEDEKAKDENKRGPGTLPYLSPETLQDSVYGEATDVYSAAVTLYELIAGRHPFSGNSFVEQIENKLNSKPETLFAEVKDKYPLLEDFFSKALATDYMRRFHSAAEMREAMQDFVKGTWKPAPAPRVKLLKKANELTEENAEVSLAALPVRQSEEKVVKEVLEKETPVSALPEIKPESESVEEEEFTLGTPDRVLEDDLLVLEGSGFIKEDLTKTPGVSSPEYKRSKSRGRFFGLLKLIVVALVAGFIAYTVYYSAPKFDKIDFSKIKNKLSEVTAYVQSYLRTEQRSEPVKEGFNLWNFFKSGTHVGKLRGLTAEGQDTWIVAQHASQGEAIIFTLSIPGWQPVLVEKAELQNITEIELSNLGYSLVLKINDSFSNQEKLAGTFDYNQGQSTGTWIVRNQSLTKSEK